jgi:hypothetical protein
MRANGCPQAARLAGGALQVSGNFTESPFAKYQKLYELDFFAPFLMAWELLY